MAEKFRLVSFPEGLQVKLNSFNFLSWQKEILIPVLHFNLDDYLFGSRTIPKKFLNDEDEVGGKINQEFLKWKQQDDELQRWIIKTDEKIPRDAYQWYKSGEYATKNNPNLKYFYNCKTGRCLVKKYVQRALDDPKTVIIHLKGQHNHDRPALRNVNGIRSYKRQKITSTSRCHFKALHGCPNNATFGAPIYATSSVNVPDTVPITSGANYATSGAPITSFATGTVPGAPSGANINAPSGADLHTTFNAPSGANINAPSGAAVVLAAISKLYTNFGLVFHRVRI
ncbi:hypothetical protein F8388_026521 [Cannabis sativa]|uniref:WRKY domain-containing protein n=1 Tax=Cannabis sativa TaxID=3483 RepID=A0A7J6EB47_CANSA|nr:hypothetical protein F8388_026521 [Cannabis sativa]KAF4366072.1 hypothetical protein G4B88_000382 [Cannabis sativa]